jgi:hypothetical protein
MGSSCLIKNPGIELVLGFENIYFLSNNYIKIVFFLNKVIKSNEVYDLGCRFDRLI